MTAKPTLLNRMRLIDACDEHIVRARKRWEDSWVTYRRLQDERVQEWVDANLDAWNDAANAIKRAVKARKPITADMLPGDRNHSVAYYRPDTLVRLSNGNSMNKPSEEFHAPREIVTLKNALHVHQEDTITPNGLEMLGVTRAALRDAVQIMGELAAKEGSA